MMVDLIPKTGVISIQLSGGLELPFEDRTTVIGPHSKSHTWNHAIAGTITELVEKRTPEHTRRHIHNLEKALLQHRAPPRGLDYAQELNIKCRAIVQHTSISTDGRLYLKTQYEHAKLILDRLHLDLTVRGSHTRWKNIDQSIKSNEVVRATHRGQNREITGQTLVFGSDIPLELREMLEKTPAKFPSRTYNQNIRTRNDPFIEPSPPQFSL